MRIRPNPDEIARRSHDLIVIGGGVYGAMLALEASLRGLSCILLEKADFGGATSFNSLRTVHGGLRYLQSFDLRRHRASAVEQAWFLRHFPDLITLQPVVMPLYQRGLLRTDVLRAALQLDGWLRYLAPELRGAAVSPPPGRVLSPDEVAGIYPAVHRDGLRGGARWHEGWIRSPQRLVMETLRSAVDRGAEAFNYMPVVELVREDSRIQGVEARDEGSGRVHRFEAPVVINATGPWSRSLAARWAGDISALFRPSVAWNVLVERQPLSPESLALARPDSGGQIFFVHPEAKSMMIGTGHAARPDHGPRDSVGIDGDARPNPTREELVRFLGDVNEAVPGIRLRSEDVRAVYAGYLPVEEAETTRLRKHPLVVEHAHDGLRGFYSASGVKYTESHAVARTALDLCFPETKGAVDPFQVFRKSDAALRTPGDAVPDDEISAELMALAAQIAAEEGVVHLDDLIFRRTTLGDDPDRARRLAGPMSEIFDWDDARRRDEILRVERTCSQAVEPF